MPKLAPTYVHCVDAPFVAVPSFAFPLEPGDASDFVAHAGRVDDGELLSTAYVRDDEDVFNSSGFRDGTDFFDGAPFSEDTIPVRSPHAQPSSSEHPASEQKVSPAPEPQRFAARARGAELGGAAEAHTALLGPLARFAAKPGVTDLFVNGDTGLWVDRGHGAEQEREWSLDEAEVRELAVHLVAQGGRHIDESTPCVDVRVGDGIRVHAVLPPVSHAGTLLSVRMPRAGGFDLDALARTGMFGAAAREVPVKGERAAFAPPLLQRLRRAVANRENVLVTGAAGSGKTTLLAAMLAEAAAGERIVTIEDVAELRIRHPHVVGLEARQANLEGAGRLGLDALLREALRMRPDRLVVGECRGSEIRELLAALNTGHDGGAGTLHANSLADVPARLEALGALAGMSPEAVARQSVSAIGLVLHIERRDGVRRLGRPGRFALDEQGRLVVVPEKGQGVNPAHGGDE